MIRTFMLMAAMTALMMFVGVLLAGEGGLVIALGVAAAMNVFAYWNSDKMVLRMYGARRVSSAQAPDLYRMVERLATNANLPMPALYIIEEDQPNAFATGRNPQNAAVAATTGLLRRLSSEEVEGVMAHELAHIKNRDTLTMTITATLAGAISMLANFALFFGNNRNNPLGILGTILVMILAPIAAALVQMAISRTREYAADKTGAEISGKPMALASALKRISNTQTPNHRAEKNPATAHMFISNPLSNQAIQGLFSTHPPMPERIRRLEALTGSMGNRGGMSDDPRFDKYRTDPSRYARSSAPTRAQQMGTSGIPNTKEKGGKPARKKPKNPWAR